MKKISLITVYNNKEMLDEMLVSAEKQKNVDIDYVMIDNRENTFSSAAAALNYGTAKAIGEVYVYLHQDVEFLTETALEQIYDFAIKNRNVIFGAAGVKRRYKKSEKIDILSSMYAYKNKDKYKSLIEPTDCFTLDECLIACYARCMTGMSFDEIICDGWHLYGTDLCLKAGTNPQLKIMVLPMDYIWHKSGGKVDESYRRIQDKLAKKYKEEYRIINSTNGFQYTNCFLRTCMNLYRKIRYRV